MGPGRACTGTRREARSFVSWGHACRLSHEGSAETYKKIAISALEAQLVENARGLQNKFLI